MNKTQILPSLLILIDLGAAIVYGINGDIRKVGYWVSAALITTFVTF